MILIVELQSDFPFLENERIKVYFERFDLN